MTIKDKIGIMIPTYVRPDFARFAVLQSLAQSLKPDVVCVHQNGSNISYDWCVKDLHQTNIHWLHSSEKLTQSQWYARPLAFLLQEGCTHFFWMDHDDIYLSNHLENGMKLLRKGFDLAVNSTAGLLKIKPPLFSYAPDKTFSSHGPGGMSSSMCFNLAFAKELILDLENNQGTFYADNIVATITMPKFRCLLSRAPSTTIYVCHENTVSSANWLADSDQWEI